MTDIAEILSQVCHSLSVTETIKESIITYLRSEWINTDSDLYAVSEDSASWSALNIPVRLKLALVEHMNTSFATEEYAENNNNYEHFNNDDTTTPATSLWRRDFDEEKQYWYYWNTETLESYWDENQEGAHEEYNEYEHCTKEYHTHNQHKCTHNYTICSKILKYWICTAWSATFTSQY